MRTPIHSLTARYHRAASRRGIALLLVLACLLLLSALILGFLLNGQNNLKSSKLYANGSSVKTLADSTVNLVMAQIQQATSNGTTVAWASQPGMIRTYSNAGSPLTNYRLFSWDSPTVAGTYDPSTDASSITGTATWYSSPAVFFDLNQPVLDATGVLHYPIVDGNPANLGNAATPTAPVSNYSAPSATTGSSTNPVLTYTYNSLTPAIEGFWVNMPNSTTTGAPGPAVNLTTATNTPNYIPMPVKWLYVLQDGTIVAPTAVAGVGTQVTVTGASSTNPIIGRIAYWTDDETAKVNINTAAEGNYWDTPRTQGITDFNMAAFQPVQNEYQRYPGHPATTCLSSVFGSIAPVNHTFQASNSNASPAYVSPTPATYAPYQFYYDLAPKLNADNSSANSANDNLGSRAGTVVWSTSATVAGSPNGDGYLTPKKGTSSTAGGDRLYASIDELMFQSNFFNDLAHQNLAPTVGYTRTVTGGLAAAGTVSITPTMLDLSKFFITADSRAPDVNLFNQPRVVCWPIGYVPSGGTTTDYRTTLDSAIGFCGTINNNIYYFQRQRSDHPTNDLPITGTTTGLGRNRMLISYLQNLTSQSIPGFGLGNFNTKYPSGTTPLATTVSERDQILTEIFDYIRCLNLNDQSATVTVAGVTTASTTYHPFAPKATTASPNNYSTTYAGTNGVTAATGNANTASAGLGQVIPVYDASTNTKGFGRFPTIQEVSIVFFATGWNDGLGGTNTSDVNYNATTKFPPSSTGGTTKIGAAFAPWGYYNDGTNSQPATTPTGPGSPVVVIPSGNIQLQAVLLISFFDPSQGNIYENNTFRIQVQGLQTNPTSGASQFQWGPNSTSLFSMGFPTTGSDTANMVTNGTTAPTQYVTNWGGNMGFREFINGSNYSFWSTVKNFTYTPPTTVPTFYFQGGDITINLLLPHLTPGWSGTTPTNWPVNSESASDPPIQQITVSLPSVALPMPTYATPGRGSNGSTTARLDRGILGNRLAYTANNYAPNAEFIANTDTVRSVRAYPGDIRLIAGQVSVTDTTSKPNALGNGYFDSSATESKMLAAMPNWNYASATTNLIHGLRESVDYPFYGALMGALVPGVSYSGGSGSAYGGNGPPYDQDVPPASGSFGLGNFASAGNNSSIKGAFIGGGTTGLAGDWDNGFGCSADGPYINKADEGNINYNANAGTTPYFSESNYGNAGGLGQTYFSPNRLMPGPGMFGSLPTGVIENIPWKTLLFCANPAAGPTHPGFGTGSGTAGPSDVPPYATNPPDHLWLDLFNMPVVEPYPISEPLSTAGRINMNYQIVPFTYIERSTGMRAVLKSERMTVIPDSLASSYKTGGGTAFKINTTGNGFGGNYDHRVPIDPDQTLRGFDYYFFNNKDIFRSASQICLMFLYPLHDANLASLTNGPKWDSANANINTFWYGSATPPGDYSKLSTGATPTHFLTGDNSRERPYTTIYPRLTTKSNTFTVHYCVETLKKVTGSTATTWDETKDQVTGQYRGSTIIERYVDPNDATLNPDGTTGVPDFANSTYYNTALDKWYRFRVVSTKEFAP